MSTTDRGPRPPAAVAHPAPTITYVQADGAARSVAVRAGMSLMEAALRYDVPGIEAKCRGNCACVTCHVRIEVAWQAIVGAPGAMEGSMLDFAEDVRASSRLACQVRVNEACDGMVVEIPAAQRTLGF